ncbi:hypothetical protein [Nitratifractor sp.]
MKKTFGIVIALMLSVNMAWAVKILSVSPSNYYGHCPVDVRVTGEMKVVVPGPFRYQFLYSDGKRSPVYHKFFMRGKHRVHTRRTFHRDFSGTVRLKVKSPTQTASSSPRHFRIRCQGQGSGDSGIHGLITQLSLNPLPILHKPCPTQVTVRGRFRHAPMTRVRYRFVRDDGVASPWISKTFTQPGIFSPKYTWNIPHSVNTRVRLQVKAKPNLPGGPSWKSYNSPKRLLKVTCIQTPLIGPMTLHADPTHYTGPCPKKIRFSGSIHFNHAGTIKYRFIRSDGAAGPIKTLHVDHAGTRLVHTYWTLNQSLSGWVRIKILSPSVHYSPKAHFNLQCQTAQSGQVTHASIHLTPSDYEGVCPVTLNIKGRIKVNGPALVRYRFLRSNGAQTPVKSMQVNQAGSYNVWNSWTIGSDYDGWQRLEVLSPNHKLSPRANFRVRCLQPSGQQESEDLLEVIVPGVVGGVLGIIGGNLIQDTIIQTPPPEGGQIGGEGGVEPSFEQSTPPVTTDERSPSTSDTSTLAESNATDESAEANDRDADGLEDRWEARMLERYRPYFLFAKEERYLPSDAIYQLRHARILSSSYVEGTPPLQMPGAIEECREIARNPSAILECGTPPADLSKTGSPLPVAADLNDSLRSDPGSGTSGDWDEAIATSAGLYGHVVPDGNRVKLEYWQFFPYSESNASAFEGGWELLELWIDPKTEEILQVCHNPHHRKICFEMKGAQKLNVSEHLVEYRGTDFNETLPPIDPLSAERSPREYQNNALRFFERDGELHPAVYVEKGSHAFWPTEAGGMAGGSPHNGDGHRYLSTLRGELANLGELGHPLPKADSSSAVILRYGGRWGAWHTPGASPQYGPTLHCDWTFPEAESDLQKTLKNHCIY